MEKVKFDGIIYYLTEHKSLYKSYKYSQKYNASKYVSDTGKTIYYFTCLLYGKKQHDIISEKEYNQIKTSKPVIKSNLIHALLKYQSIK